MSWLIDKTLSFFVENTPPWQTILWGGPVCLAWALACLFIAGLLKQKKKLKTGYTRKIFHFQIFTSVAVIQWAWGTPIVCLFGGMAALVVLLAIFKGSGNILYEAMAREKDEPRRTYYIVVPFFASLIGGLVSNILFGPIAVVGYLVTGLGDAVGEPVGTRFGKHLYKVPTFTSVKSTRSLEGSAAVLAMSIVAIVCAIFLLPELSFGSWSLIKIVVLGLVCALVEAVSPHGWDNATMQIIPVFLAEMML